MRYDDSTISASQLAELGFCETKVLLKLQQGDVDTVESLRLKDQGIRVHESVHQTVSRHHNNRPSTTDKRCFIASAVYGLDDPRTDQLRLFRDRCLKQTWAGNALVVGYYAVSPALVWVLGRARWLKPVAALVLDYIRGRIASTMERKEASYEHAVEQGPVAER